MYILPPCRAVGDGEVAFLGGDIHHNYGDLIPGLGLRVRVAMSPVYPVQSYVG